MLKNIFKSLGIAITLIFMLATVVLSLMIYKMLFSGNLATVIISAVFIAYILLTSYLSSLLALWISFWSLPVWVARIFITASLVVLVSILGLIAVAYNAGPSGIAIILPHLIYGYALFRFMKNPSIAVNHEIAKKLFPEQFTLSLSKGRVTFGLNRAGKPSTSLRQ